MINHLNRRGFLAVTTLAGAGWLAGRSLPTHAAGITPAGPFGTDVATLLTDWCEALLKLQYSDASQPEQFGAFRCPACGIIHGRGGDATYPLLHMAARTKRQDFLEAALRAQAWMRNVDSPDGAWLNDPHVAHSWKGITVFGGIALAESLRHHGTLLDHATRETWSARLRRAADFVNREFHWNNYSNINYPVTASYALTLFGEVLEDARLTARGREFARRSLDYLTKPSRLLYGEGKPYEQRSLKGCVPVDLGYNVEESLQALAQYGLLTGDEDVLGPVVESLKAHLEFMLPDGGWDNSWGTRSYKWTWWGSRTSDGSVPAYALLARREPTFAACALANLAALRACTRDGLLHGGPHYHAHGFAPCVHHTFCHAKALAALLDHPAFEPNLITTAPLPRAAACGVRAFPEVQVWLAANGPWRGTVSAYDWFNVKPGMTTHQATGGSLALLWHEKVGAVLSASLADYVLWEPTNMQKLNAPDFPLTPRVERMENGKRFTNLYDGAAQVAMSEEGGAQIFRVQTRLLAVDGESPADGVTACELIYRLAPGAVQIEAAFTGSEAACAACRLVLPVVATAAERATQPTDQRLTVAKVGGVVCLDSATPLLVTDGLDHRVFNPVPGFEAVPVSIPPDAAGRCRVSLWVTPSV